MQGLISSEQDIFGGSVKRFAEQEYGVGLSPHRLAFDRARLRRLGDLGVLSLAIPEEMGGIGGAVEAMVALAALAPALPPEPIVASSIHAAALIAEAAPSDVAAPLLQRIAEGQAVAAVADLEAAARYDRAAITATAVAKDGSYLLDGVKPMVPFGAEADLLVVSANVGGDPALFLVDPRSDGVTRTSRPRIDAMPAADIVLSGCAVPSASRLEHAPVLPALERAADLATAAQIAEMVGLMDALIAATVDYAHARKQFGVAIGSFQAIQHRIADMWIACEEARSLAAAAALACASGETGRARTVSAAMITACDAAHRVGNEAIQIHGGIGMTDELVVSH
ncbi:acyl-CoA dehydrogenase family protein [Mesorhizobium sp. J428]|uniref:acyl-CoA dehydrogenase family protein n=1 Tax=Mesorhizobium sp. J428 TaxID=2898440 RepID=UPI002151A810|nr:acyl-CoA dehydrogenase family protein [Mesorhizobium sp. J428]MCR5859698.1 acyl-CoA dehydrogenase family protein [Mesorhizobium sp. J428]